MIYVQNDKFIRKAFCSRNDYLNIQSIFTVASISSQLMAIQQRVELVIVKMNCGTEENYSSELINGEIQVSTKYLNRH